MSRLTTSSHSLLLLDEKATAVDKAACMFFFLPLLSGLSSSSGCGQSPTWRGPRLPRPGSCSCQRCRDAKRKEWASGFWGIPCEHDTVRTGKSKLLLSADCQACQVLSVTVWESVCVCGFLLWGSRWKLDLVSSFLQMFSSFPDWLCQEPGSFWHTLKYIIPCGSNHSYWPKYTLFIKCKPTQFKYKVVKFTYSGKSHCSN